MTPGMADLLSLLLPFLSMGFGFLVYLLWDYP